MPGGLNIAVAGGMLNGVGYFLELRVATKVVAIQTPRIQIGGGDLTDIDAFGGQRADNRIERLHRAVEAAQTSLVTRSLFL